MANIENLQPGNVNHTFTPEEVQRGAVNSAITRKKKKNMREALKLLLELDVKSPKAREQLARLGVEEEDMTNEMALMVAMLNKGLKGDNRAAEFVRDTSGQKPVEVQEHREAPRIIDDI